MSSAPFVAVYAPPVVLSLLAPSNTNEHASCPFCHRRVLQRLVGGRSWCLQLLWTLREGKDPPTSRNDSLVGVMADMFIGRGIGPTNKSS
jgi:hypothetical protein